MFSSKSKTKSKAKRPAPANASSASSQQQKPAEKPRAPVQEVQEARPGPTDSSSLLSNLSFEGDLKFSGTVLIDCDFRGTVVTEDTLVVGTAGTVRAEVTAGVVEVSGKVHGNISASTRVKIYSGGEVHGNIETPTISMEEGVVFEGNCTRPGSTRPQVVVQPQAQVEKPQPQALTEKSQALTEKSQALTEKSQALTEKPQAQTSETTRPKPQTFDSASLERKKVIVAATELAEMR